MEKQEKVKVAAYCRVSTKKDEQLNSLENQQSYFEKEISKNKSYDLYKIYVDRGLSALTMSKRKEFLNMVYDAGIDYKIKGVRDVDFIVSDREPKFNRLFVSNTSRFARNIDVIPLIRKLREKGVYIHFLDISKTTESVDDETFITIFMTFAQQESIDKSKKVRFGQKQSAENGVIMLNSRIYGYKRTEENELVVIEEEAEVIRKIFEIHAQGIGIRRTTNMINEMGYRTRAGKEFSHGTVSGIVRNSIYYGTLVRGKTTYGKDIYTPYNSRRTKQKSEWYIHENRVPPIISKELFEQARIKREDNTISQKQIGVNKGKSEFAGKIVCSKCGANYIHNTELVKKKDGKEWRRNFYICCTKKIKGLKECDNINIQEWQLNLLTEDLAKKSLNSFIAAQGIATIQALMDKKKSLQKQINQDNISDVEKLHVELKKLEQSKNRLLEVYLEGGFDKDFLELKKNELNEAIEKIKVEIGHKSKSNDEIKSEIEKIDTQINELQSLRNTLHTQKYTPEEIKDMIEKIEIVERNHQSSNKNIRARNQVPKIKVYINSIAMSATFSSYVHTESNVLYDLSGFYEDMQDKH